MRAFASGCFSAFLLVTTVSRAETFEIAEDVEQIAIVTPQLEAAIRKKGYVSGVAAGSLIDRKTGFRDVGFGLDIVDWILEPGSDEAYRDQLHPQLAYGHNTLYHGKTPKRSLEGPQICTQAKEVRPEIIRGKDFVAVRTSFQYRIAAPGKRTGSRWTQTIIFPQGVYEDRAKGGIVYSDDHGRTWRVGGAGFAELGPVNGEVALCETSSGEVYVNYRNCDASANPRRRLYSRSRDGGASFYQEGAAEDLPAHGCNAGLTSFTPAGAEKPLLLLTYPLESNRNKLTCYLSRDDGRSWLRTKRISDHGGYSDVAVLSDGTILVLYEKSRTAGICLARASVRPPRD
jgi:hypothetical protein